MAGSLVKNDPDSKETIKLWQQVRRFMDEKYPDAVMLSEWGEPDKSLMGGFHMDFLLHFGPSHYMDLFRCEHPFFSREGKGNARAFVDTYEKNYRLTRGKGLMCIPSGNHDMERLRHWLDPEEMKIAFTFLLSMPGAPFVYYGDEIGMRYLELDSVEGGYNRTGSRSPMQWDHGRNYGFSAAEADQLYTAQDRTPDAPTVADGMAEAGSLWHTVQTLCAVRKAHPALQADGTMEFIYCETDAYPLVYLRTGGGEKILAAVNPAARAVRCPCALSPAGQPLFALGGPAALQNGVLTMPAESAVLLPVE